MLFFAKSLLRNSVLIASCVGAAFSTLAYLKLKDIQTLPTTSGIIDLGYIELETSPPQRLYFDELSYQLSRLHGSLLREGDLAKACNPYLSGSEPFSLRVTCEGETIEESRARLLRVVESLAVRHSRMQEAIDVVAEMERQAALAALAQATRSIEQLRVHFSLPADQRNVDVLQEEVDQIARAVDRVGQLFIAPANVRFAQLPFPDFVANAARSLGARFSYHFKPTQLRENSITSAHGTRSIRVILAAVASGIGCALATLAFMAIASWEKRARDQET